MTQKGAGHLREKQFTVFALARFGSGDFARHEADGGAGSKDAIEATTAELLQIVKAELRIAIDVEGAAVPVGVKIEVIDFKLFVDEFLQNSHNVVHAGDLDDPRGDRKTVRRLVQVGVKTGFLFVPFRRDMHLVVFVRLAHFIPRLWQPLTQSPTAYSSKALNVLTCCAAAASWFARLGP
jgi:hypothetical protein